MSNVYMGEIDCVHPVNCQVLVTRQMYASIVLHRVGEKLSFFLLGEQKGGAKVPANGKTGYPQTSECTARNKQTSSPNQYLQSDSLN